MDLTKEELEAIRTLQMLANNWPKRLFLSAIQGERPYIRVVIAKNGMCDWRETGGQEYVDMINIPTQTHNPNDNHDFKDY